MNLCVRAVKVALSQAGKKSNNRKCDASRVSFRHIKSTEKNGESNRFEVIFTSIARCFVKSIFKKKSTGHIILLLQQGNCFRKKKKDDVQERLASPCVLSSTLLSTAQPNSQSRASTNTHVNLLVHKPTMTRFLSHPTIPEVREERKWKEHIHT